MCNVPEKGEIGVLAMTAGVSTNSPWFVRLREEKENFGRLHFVSHGLGGKVSSFPRSKAYQHYRFARLLPESYIPSRKSCR